MFQSHAGSIEALTPRARRLRLQMFQSHAGSIEAPEHVVPARAQDPGFNPTLVRLRPQLDQLGPFIPLQFQSHAGSIEATLELGAYVQELTVSIPRWFD